MKKVELVLFEPLHTSWLERLLENFGVEVFNSRNKIDVDRFINNHHGYIYLAVNEYGIPVGFSSFTYNDWYGLREPTLSNDFIYIEPAYRRSKAMHLFSIQAGYLCESMNLPLEHHTASAESEMLTSRLKGKKLYTTYLYPIDSVIEEYSRLKTKIRIQQ